MDVNLVKKPFERLALKDSLIDLMKGVESYCGNTYQSSACKNLFYIKYCLLCVVSEGTLSAGMLSRWVY